MKNSFFRISYIIIGIYFFTTLNSCNDVPTDIPLIQDTLELYSLSSNDAAIIDSQLQAYQELKGPFNTQYQLVGRYNQFKSHAMYRFFGIPKDMEYITLDDIRSAKLYLFPDGYSFGDTNSYNQDFSVFEVIDTISREDTYSKIFDSQDNSSKFASTEIGSFAGNAEPKDSVPIIIDLNYDIIVKWFKFASIEDSLREIYLDPEQELDMTKEENRYLLHSYSIGLRANENSNVITRFLNRTDLDTLYNTYVKLVVAKQGKDTTIIIKNSIAAFYPTAPPIEENGNINMQGVGQTRSLLSFNLDTIPALSAILSAKLELHLDTSNSLFGTFGNSIYLAGAANDDPFFLPSNQNQFSWSYLAISDSTDKYTFNNLTPILDRWNREEGKGKFLLSPSRGTSALVEFSNFDIYSFYGINNPDITKRPKLLIIYSKRPQI